MNYELAKQLKDAGFPKELTVWFNPDGTDDPRNGERLPFPTLSELITACGDVILEVDKDLGSRVIRTSKAQVVSAYDWYLTPEEAVAKLWLALNPKKD